jgi:hypothetical protein
LSSSTFFSSIVEDNNELGGLSSSLGFIPQLQKMKMSQNLGSSSSLVVFLQLQKTTTNREINCHFLHFFL